MSRRTQNDRPAARVLLCLCLSVGGCTQTYDGRWNPPLLYRLDIQQGNDVQQYMLDKLKPGMNREQVLFIMGTPILIDPFREDRWDYIYTFQKRGGIPERRHVVLHFDEDQLTGLTGDIEPGMGNRNQDPLLPPPQQTGQELATTQANASQSDEDEAQQNGTEATPDEDGAAEATPAVDPAIDPGNP